MKDIDFDELDRAVSSALSGKKPAAPDTTVVSDDAAVSDTNTANDNDTVSSGDQISVKTSAATSAFSFDSPPIKTHDDDDKPEVAETEERTDATDTVSFGAPASDETNAASAETSQEDTTPLEANNDASTTTDAREANSEDNEIQDEGEDEDKVNVNVTSASKSTDSDTVQPPKRSGRFMDMVHPSSDMNESNSDAAGSTPLPGGPRRLEPINRDIKPEPRRDASDNADRPAGKTVPPARGADPTSLTATPDTEEHAWPDPLDVHGFVDEDEDEAQADSEAARDKTDHQPSSLQEEPILDPAVVPKKPLPGTPVDESPFISNSEISKRPLGSFGASEDGDDTNTSDEEPSTDPSLPATNLTSETPKRDDAQTPPANAETLPPELDHDVVEVDNVDHSEPTSAAATTPAPAKNSGVTDPTFTGHHQTSTKSAAAAAEHPVFDTNEYHPALPAHASHHSSPWPWIVAIILLVLALAAVGAYYWFFLR